MKISVCALACLALCCVGMPAFAAAHPAAAATHPKHSRVPPRATKSVTHGSVVVEGQRIDYTATAGTIILKNRAGKPTGSMFYVAYVKSGVAHESQRPVTFFYNGGPGSSSVWLHMSAYGPVRVVTADHTHTKPAPYKLVNNDYSLLDATDEVFVDAMSTGYSRIIRKDQGGAGTSKDFYGRDPDARSFAQFIKRYLSENNRWNSPKYLYGESYGTVRSEILANYLEQVDDIDPNGVILQSAYTGNPVMFRSDIAFETNLPSMAAVAWYHHVLVHQSAHLRPFVAKVAKFSLDQYALALNQGNALSTAKRNQIAEKLHDYIGLSVAFIKKANLRVTLGEFQHDVLGAKGLTTGLLDGRFAQPTMNLLSRATPGSYDPTAASIMPADVAGFNHYVRDVLKYGRGRRYRPVAYNIINKWPHKDKNLLTGHSGSNPGMDLTQAMKWDPHLRVEVDAGYYDLNLPWEGMHYSVEHLNLPKDLQSHIQFKFYKSGHMIYLHVPALKRLHANTVAFIRSTDNLPAPAH